MMKKQTPDTTTAATLEAWFADAGLLVEIVDRCPSPACERCKSALKRAA